MNSLRECFAKLKVERDSLISEMDEYQLREKEWKFKLESMNDELARME